MKLAMTLAGGGVLAVLAALFGKMMLGWLFAVVAFVATMAFKLLVLAVVVWVVMRLVRSLKREPRES